ncbi:MAG: DUF58 domain-containing protein [Paracoccus sp. (in: a-proteobacteria)]|uniref:DUF58 domain-containing protein n=1 Tax=Paracoccus sp. TaxID=267 RepID=UPI0026E0ED5D|nr:DUF58 domain-containing protein [Paracoccus sp. (in: a-proteobacteria)]MDO5612129.1 DUF58 domain-containing protein [Paracoccus sp. (in: a-proteobacteria)]
MSVSAADLRARADAASAHLPPLILSAQRLAALIAPGAHGLRRAGPGEDFWQYRPAQPGDTARSIDWRRSARSDARFVRDREAQTAQAVSLWVAGGPGMAWSGAPDRPTKQARAQVLALSLALVLLRGGEKVGLAGGDPARAGRAQGERLAQELLLHPATEALPAEAARPGQRLVLIGDFLTPVQPLLDLIARAAAMGLRGVVLQVLDPDEETFPYAGSVLFQAPGGAARHDTRDAAGLRDAYLARLAQRRADIRAACAAAGWRFGTHDTAAAPAQALMWLYQMLEE